MCGIVGIIGKAEVAPLLLDGLKRLEYRGYDSAGIATLVGGKIERRRAEGKLGNLDARLKAEPLPGVIGIAQVANASANMGLPWFLNFLALISLSLAILNLLPIPVLDGGHLLYYVVELIKGSPVSEQTMIVGQYIGLALLFTLMGLAFYNDIHRMLLS